MNSEPRSYLKFHRTTEYAEHGRILAAATVTSVGGDSPQDAATAHVDSDRGIRFALDRSVLAVRTDSQRRLAALCVRRKVSGGRPDFSLAIPVPGSHIEPRPASLRSARRRAGKGGNQASASPVGRSVNRDLTVAAGHFEGVDSVGLSMTKIGLGY